MTSKSASVSAKDPSKEAPQSIYAIHKANPAPAFVFNPTGNWKSYGSDKEIAAAAPPKMDRAAPTTMHFTMRRDFFLKRRTLHNFLNRDAADGESQLLRPTKDALKEDPWLMRMESDASVQAVKTKADHATQVPHFRKVDFSVQIQPEVVDACAPPPVKPAFADGTAADEVDPEEAKENKRKLRGFFDRVMPRMLHHLTQAAAIPLFQDDFQLLMDEDASAVVSNREESDLIEAGNFSHAYTRERHISSIDWKPGPKMVLAVASIKASSLESRFEASLDVEPSVSVIWSLHEQTNPQMLLESPAEVFCIKFHPKPLSQIVVAGLSNGQIAMWDMSRAPVDARAARAAASGGGGGAGGGGGGAAGGGGGAGGGGAATAAMGRAHLTMEEEVMVNIPPLPQPIRGHTTEIATDEHVVSRLQPSMTSRVENSHRRAVHDICWLPDALECGFDGRATVQEQVYQFATISEDGFVFIWDLRPENLPSDRLRKLKHQGRSTGDEHAKVWVPMLRYQLPRSEQPGDLLGLRLHIEGRTQNGQGPPSYLFMASTVEGEVCCGNWGPKPGTEDAPKSLTGYDAGAPAASAGQQKVVRYISSGHAGPVWGLHRHPQLADIFLTVGDWGFKVWRVGIEVPILSSPMGDQQTTCGRWSTTRPGLVFIGTRDGFVQVWDLLDRSHQPVLVHAVIKDAITCVEFRPVQNPTAKRVQTQTIALGTKNGGFHFYELPRSLVRGPSAELKMARQLFDRETRRVSYYSWRWEERRREMELRAAAVSVSEADGGAAAGGADDKQHQQKPTTSSSKQQSSKHDDLLGGKEDEGVGDFTFTADDDSRYLAMVEELAQADTRLSMSQKKKETTEEQ